MVEPASVLRWLDSLGEPGGDRDEVHQARLVHGVSGLMMLFVPAFALLGVGALDAPRTGAATALLGSGMATGPWLLRRFGASVAVHTVVGSLFFTILVVSLLNGGHTSGFAYALAVVPMLAMAAQGAPAALSWLGAVGIALIGQYGQHRLGGPLPAELGATEHEIFGLAVALCMPLIIVATMGLQRLTRAAYARDLAEQQRTLRAVFEHTPEGLLLSSANGELESANEAAVRLLGADAVAASLPRLMQPTPGWREIELRHPQGRRLRVAVATVPLTEGGRCLTVLHDLTARRQVQRAMAHARDQALEAQRAKSTFLANMSHELRTPLNAVIGYGEMVADDLEARDDELLDDVHLILGAARHLLQLVDDVLDLSRLEAGELLLSVQEVALGSLLHDVAGAAEPLFATRGNHFELHVDPDLGTLQSDPIRLRQVLLHLLANAARFTDHGRITLRGTRQGSDQVRLEVRDEGIGMSPTVLARVMQPFEQADGSSTRAAGGSGVGLPLVQHLVDSMGGHLTLRSTVGVGTVASIDLPTEPSTARRARRAEPMSNPPT